MPDFAMCARACPRSLTCQRSALVASARFEQAWAEFEGGPKCSGYIAPPGEVGLAALAVEKAYHDV